MKLHIVTIGKPKLAFAREGFEEYVSRISRMHELRVTHIADKHNDSRHILDASKGSYSVAMVIDGPQMSSERFADFLRQQELKAREVSFLIGGPDGLPEDVINNCSAEMGLSKLTLPHDLAMVFLAETIYRSSTINTGHPYHK